MAARRLQLFLILPIVVMVMPTRAQAQWQLNGGLVCATPATQSSPRVVPDGRGGTIIVWQDNRAGNYDIYAQRLDGFGHTKWAEGGVAVSTAPLDQGNATLVGDGTGGVVIAWEDLRNGGMDIYAQKLDSLGAPLWSPNGVTICTDNGTQNSPTLLPDGAGGGVVVWIDSRLGTSKPFAQRVDHDGIRLWTPNGIQVSTVNSPQTNPVMVPDGSGGVVVAWEDNRSGQDVYMQRLSSGGTRMWTPSDLAVCVANGSQAHPSIVVDGSGATILGWEDFRTGGSHIYAQKMTASGLPAWTDNGVPLCTATGNRTLGCLTLDGAGGAIATWSDARNFGQYDLYVQRVNVFGVPQWASDGIVICNAAGNQTMPKCVGGGSGGFVLAWTDSRFGTSDVFAQRVLTDGSVQWSTNGRQLSKQRQIPPTFAIDSDGSGGAIFVWSETRYVDSDIYGQRILDDGRPGYFLNLAATIAAAQDVPGDQGGWLNVSVVGAAGDPGQLEPYVTGYNLWRRVETVGPSSAQLPLTSVELGPVDGSITALGWLSASAATAAGFPPGSWASLGFTAATQSAACTLLAPTRGDSTATGQSSEVFVVTVHTGDPAIFTVSAPDSGHSVDNLPPSSPGSFSAQYTNGLTSLHWAPNAENDLSGYLLYRGTSSSFVPDPAHLVASLSDTGYVDASGMPYYYKLTAVDVHGNMSAFAMVLPSGTTDVASEGTLRFEISGVRPNPATRGEFDVFFTLAARGAATLELLDVTGRRVAAREVGSLGPGTHSVDLSKSGTLRPGIYFLRLAQGGSEVRARAVVTK